MDSSKRKQGSRRVAPTAEGLEDRQLLSRAALDLRNAIHHKPLHVYTPPVVHHAAVGHGHPRIVARATHGHAGMTWARYVATPPPNVAPSSPTATGTTPTTIPVSPAAAPAVPVAAPASSAHPVTITTPATPTTPVTTAATSTPATPAPSTPTTPVPPVVITPVAVAPTPPAPAIPTPATPAVPSTPAPPPAATTTPTSPSAPSLTFTSWPAQLSTVTTLVGDEATILNRSHVTPQMRSALSTDIASLSKDLKTSPSQTQMATLKADLAAAGAAPTQAQLGALGTDYAAVLGSAGVTDSALIQKTFGDLQTFVNALGVKPSDTSRLTSDLQAAGFPATTPLPGDLGVTYANMLMPVVNAQGQAQLATPWTPAAPTPGGTTLAGTAAWPAQLSTVMSLLGDEATTLNRSHVTPQMRSALSTDVAAISQGITKTPGAAPLATLKADLATSGAAPTQAQLATLGTDYAAVMNSAGVTDSALIQKTFGDLQTFINALGVTPAETSRLISELQAAGLPANTPLQGDLGVTYANMLMPVVNAQGQVQLEAPWEPASTKGATT
jgi:hypothetical protein